MSGRKITGRLLDRNPGGRSFDVDLTLEDEPAPLLRDTPEDRERLGDLLHDALLDAIRTFGPEGPQYAEPSWPDTKANAIIAALRGER